MTSARSIRVRGVVQGVGFRPFVFRLARANALAGWVLNEEDGVEIHLEGAEPRWTLSCTISRRSRRRPRGSPRWMCVHAEAGGSDGVSRFDE